MNPKSDYTFPVVDSVLHPSDFSAGSLTAFHHALKAAIIAKSKFTILHVSPEAAAAWTDFPGVRETLERWGLIPPGSPKSAVPQLGMDVRKAVARDTSPAKSVLRYLEEHPADLIVLATHAHEGRASWLKQSVAEPIARRSGQMTLFIPDHVRGFVSAEDGSVSLEHILIPIASQPRPQSAVAAAAQLAARLQCARGTFTLLHVGDEGAMPVVQCSSRLAMEEGHAHRRRDSRHCGHSGQGSRRSDRDVHGWTRRFSGCPARQPQRTGFTERALSAADRPGKLARRGRIGMSGISHNSNPRTQNL